VERMPWRLPNNAGALSDGRGGAQTLTEASIVCRRRLILIRGKRKRIRPREATASLTVPLPQGRGTSALGVRDVCLLFIGPKAAGTRKRWNSPSAAAPSRPSRPTS